MGEECSSEAAPEGASAQEARPVLVITSRQDMAEQFRRKVESQPLLRGKTEVALNDVEACNPGFCPRLVVLDASFPPNGAMEAVERVRRVQPNVPVILFGAECDACAVMRAIRRGSTDFFVMSDNTAHLSQVVRAVLDGEQAGPSGSDQLLSRRPALLGCLQHEPLNPRMRAIRSMLPRVSSVDAPVLVVGESGVGKEILVRELHALSPRADKPFLKLNCAALPSELLESELFGYERGAFTGAFKTTPGKFEVAHRGSLFLDEIGELDIKLQAKLLHVLEDGEFLRLGGTHPIRVDVRLMAATNSDLATATVEGRFRRDLYYRLDVIRIEVPPLRERKDEIIPLAEFFLAKHARPGTVPLELHEELKRALLEHDWPGNIRELENIIQRLLVLGDAGSVLRELFRERTRTLAGTEAEQQPCSRSGNHQPTPFEAASLVKHHMEAQAIRDALDKARWNRRKAAALLNIEYRSLLYRIKKLGIGGR